MKCAGDDVRPSMLNVSFLALAFGSKKLPADELEISNPTDDYGQSHLSTVPACLQAKHLLSFLLASINFTLMVLWP